jgi:hypothetical protein
MNKGVKDHHAQFCLTDMSRVGSAPIGVSIYRSDREAIPQLNAGDCIILRDFAVCLTNNNILYLESREESAWCIRRCSKGYKYTGPMVRFGAEEAREMKHLRNWWRSSGPSSGLRGLTQSPVYP